MYLYGQVVGATLGITVFALVFGFLFLADSHYLAQHFDKKRAQRKQERET
jgi:hypothetical protein